MTDLGATSPTAKLALACSLAALLISVWAAVRTDPAAPLGPDTDVATNAPAQGPVATATVGSSGTVHEFSATLIMVQALERRVAQLEKQLTQSTRKGGARAAPDNADTVSPPTLFSKLVSPQASVRVTQDDEGHLQATNSDPELTGKTLVIEATRADGSSEQLTVTVPAPEK